MFEEGIYTSLSSGGYLAAVYISSPVVAGLSFLQAQGNYIAYLTPPKTNNGPIQILSVILLCC